MSGLGNPSLLEWSWHHFRPLGRADNYLPILGVLAAHEGEPVKDAREDVNAEVDALDLEVGLGKRKGQAHPDIFRDRLDVWRFTGALLEPGLVGETIQLTELGRLLLAEPDSFERIMARQALRLSYPRVVRIRLESEVPRAVDALSEALALGPGLNVVRAWVVAAGCLRALAGSASMSGESAIRYLSGIASIDEVPKRMEMLVMDQSGFSSGVPELSPDRGRQGRELEVWLQESGALTPSGEARFSLDPEDRQFRFNGASAEELLRWNRWWGSAG